MSDHRKPWQKRDDVPSLGSRKWRATRAAKLQRDPLCERCLAGDRVREATTVHHREHRAAGGDVFDENNLESLCASCHDEEHRPNRRPRIGPDGFPL